MIEHRDGNPVIAEAYRWVDMPKLIEQYRALARQGDGEFRVFGYASSIFNNLGFNPVRVDEHVHVEGRHVTMGVYAVGPYEFRGTVRYQIDGTLIHTVGAYPTLKDGGRAEGVNIIIEDSVKSLAYLYEREFGKPPNGITLEEMAGGDMEAIGHRLAEAGESHLYKLQIINVHTADGIKPALAVSVNERSRFSALDECMETIADAIVEGHGEVRDNGQPGKRFGGSCLEEFIKLMGLYRTKGYNQPEMEVFAGKVSQLTVERHMRFRVSELPELCSSLRDELMADVEAKSFAAQIKPKRFAVGEQMADRGAVPEALLVKTTIPITDDQKKIWLTSVVTGDGFQSLKR